MSPLASASSMPTQHLAGLYPRPPLSPLAAPTITLPVPCGQLPRVGVTSVMSTPVLNTSTSPWGSSHLPERSSEAEHKTSLRRRLALQAPCIALPVSFERTEPCTSAAEALRVGNSLHPLFSSAPHSSRHAAAFGLGMTLTSSASLRGRLQDSGYCLRRFLEQKCY